MSTIETSPTADQTATSPPPTIDEAKLMGFVFRAVDEVGATLNCALVVMGDKLGYYRALADHGPLTPAELAERTDTGEHYAREWLNAQAAGGYVTYDPATRPLHAAARARRRADRRDQPGVPARVLPDRLRHRPRRRPRSSSAARDGDGIGWHQHNTDVHVGCERFFRPGYHANLVAELAARPGRRGRPSCERGAGSPTSAAGTARRPS